MAISNEVIWEQVFPEDAESRIQQAFLMLLGDEFGLTDSGQLGTAIDQHFWENYNQDNEKTIDIRGNCRTTKSIKKVDP